MNQRIKIRYKPTWHFNPNYWNIWFRLNDKDHREKAPSDVNSYGHWDWAAQGKFQKSGKDFDWNIEMRE